MRNTMAGVRNAALRGTVAAMSMTGMRALTTRLGLLSETPPEVVASHAPAALRQLPEQKLQAAMVLLHWTYGSVGGAAFGALPARVRLTPWSGPLFGALLWAGFEVVLVPFLGLRMADRSQRDRAALAADHLLYGLVLSEMRRKPRE